MTVGGFYLKGQNVFIKKRSYFVVFEQISGLVVSNPIRVNGFKVGQVANISLRDDRKILCELLIEQDDLQVTQGSVAMLDQDLFGAMSINLKINSSTEQLCAVGDTLSGKKSSAITEVVMQQLKPLVVKVERVIETIDTLTVDLQSVVGGNKHNLNNIFDSLTMGIEQFTTLATSMNGLIEDNKSKLTSTLTSIDSVMASLKESNQDVSNVLANLSDISDSLADAGIRSTIIEARTALNGVNAILYQINNGDGTLSQLIKSPELIDKVEAMVDEAQRLIENIKEHPNRYLQFSVFGGKSKGLKLDSRDEENFKKWVKECLPKDSVDCN